MFFPDGISNIPSNKKNINMVKNNNFIIDLTRRPII